MEEKSVFKGWEDFAKDSLLECAKFISEDGHTENEYGYCHSCIMNSLNYLRNKRLQERKEDGVQ